MTLEQQKETTAPKTNGNAAPEEVKDWAHDYDIFDRDYIKDPFPVWDELREKCPIAHTERWGGSWMPTRYADLFAIAPNHVEIKEVNHVLPGQPIRQIAQNTAKNQPK